jgi:tRNA threonylcarbamoyl adenosine modification protein YeaZ
MRLLAIDTALDACSVGVTDGELLVTRSEIVGRGHAEILMGLITGALAEAGLAVSDITRIAVTVGPGSFTGLRIGIAAARGLALVTGAEVVGIGTLAVHAEEARAARGAASVAVPVLALIAAGRGEIYGARYSADGREEVPPAVAAPAYFAALIEDNVVLAGSGADAVAALAPGAERRIVHRHAAPDIAALCRLGVRAAAASGPVRPLYLRPPDAKPQAAAALARR